MNVPSTAPAQKGKLDRPLKSRTPHTCGFEGRLAHAENLLELGSLIFRVSPSNVGPVPDHLLLPESKRRTFLQGQGEGRECKGRKGRRGGVVPMYAPCRSAPSECPFRIEGALMKECDCMNVGQILTSLMLQKPLGFLPPPSCPARTMARQAASCAVGSLPSKNQGDGWYHSFQDPS
eukprot:1081178-Pelagomonas_calceolata.AAC.1